MDEEKKNIVRKLMRDVLDEQETRSLSHDPRVERRMRSQWEEDGDSDSPDREAGDRVWKRIAGRIDGGGMARRK